MKSDKEVNEQGDKDNQTQEGGAKKGTSNAKNYTSQCTGLGLHKIFAVLPEEEKCALRATCFAPLLLIDPITMIMRRFTKKKNTYGLKDIDDALKQAKLERHQDDILRLNLLKIKLSFLLPNKGRNVWVKYVDLVDSLDQFNKFPWAMKPSETDMQQDLVQGAMRHQIEVPAISAPAIVTPTIGRSSSAIEIGTIVVRVYSQLEEHGKMLLKLDDHGKMLHNHGKILKQISMSNVGDNTLPLGDTPLHVIL
ncbi:hypothetical protein GIB67_041343 [Kingdonia uniflora]|uniref:Uncharacterized protein n=1 Tax=Kingdonia uniflora TaxID=39325 RepID=A0A7J7NJL8_9MAGN|nr:hypothetical protein GIB67_041343 [Kingdonia uniflora]